MIVVVVLAVSVSVLVNAQPLQSSQYIALMSVYAGLGEPRAATIAL